MALTEPLAIDLRCDDADTIRLILRGELDLDTAPAFAEHLQAACEQHPCELLLDFKALAFCDSSGIRACVNAAATCTQSGVQMRIVGANLSVRRVFEIVGLADYFEWLD